MTKRSLTALVVLNAVLLAAVVVTAFAPPTAQAQFGARTQYMIIAGEVRGRPQQEGIYVIDRRSAQVLGLFFNSSNDQVEGVAPPRSIANDVRRAQGG